MASSSGVYTADDLLLPSTGSPQSDFVTRRFKVTVSTALAQTGAAKFLQGDIILLAPIPPQCTFLAYHIYVPSFDSNGTPTASFDVGDTQVLTGALTAITSGSVALPAVGTTFTLTATASTSSFTATNGMLNVNGLIVNYESLSGSTFVNCRTFTTGAVIPNGAPIQALTNTAAYQAITIVTTSTPLIMTPDYAISAANAIVTGTPVPNGTPVIMPPAYQTAALKIGALGPTFGNIQPYYFILRLHANVATQVTTGVILGWVQYYMAGM